MTIVALRETPTRFGETYLGQSSVQQSRDRAEQLTQCTNVLPPPDLASSMKAQAAANFGCLQGESSLISSLYSLDR